MSNNYVLLDSYKYCSKEEEDIKKKEYYEKIKYTEEEKEKTKLLQKRISKYIMKVHKKDMITFFCTYVEEANIKYKNGKGYILSINADRDIVKIYSYGSTEDEAFYNAIIGLEFKFCSEYELKNRNKLELDYKRRFPDESDYYGPFFFAELALKNLRKYYGNNLPVYFIDYYEKELEDNYGERRFIYDYETNSIISLK